MGGVREMKSKLIIAMATLVFVYPCTLTQGSTVSGDGDCCNQTTCCQQTTCCPQTTCCGQTSMPYTEPTAQSTGPFSADELDNLLAPIALYPDPLLAQILPASTFVDQDQQAAAWVRTNH